MKYIVFCRELQKLCFSTENILFSVKKTYAECLQILQKMPLFCKNLCVVPVDIEVFVQKMHFSVEKPCVECLKIAQKMQLFCRFLCSVEVPVECTENATFLCISPCRWLQMLEY